MAVENDTRARLLELVRERPGEGTRRIAQLIGREETGIDYHLRRLQREGAVRSHPFGRERLWFASDCGLCPVLRRAVPLLRSAEATALADALDDVPRSAAQLATRAGVPVGRARWLTQRLTGVFIAERSTSGRVALRRGAQICRDAAREGARCEMWGRCEVSGAWRAALAGGAAPVAQQLTSSR